MATYIAYTHINFAMSGVEVVAIGTREECQAAIDSIDPNADMYENTRWKNANVLSYSAFVRRFGKRRAGDAIEAFRHESRV